MINTLVLAGGHNVFHLLDLHEMSKLSFDIGGISLLETAIETYRTGKTHLVINELDKIDVTRIDELSIVRVENTQGALISSLIALKDMNLQEPLVIAPFDSLIPRESFREFIEDSNSSNVEVSIVTFPSEKPEYSYIRTFNGQMVEICEKKVISSVATAGIFYFSSASLFLECAEWSIINNNKTNNQFFIAPSLNYLAIKGIKPILYEIDERQYFRFAEYQIALESRERYVNESN